MTKEMIMIIFSMLAIMAQTFSMTLPYWSVKDKDFKITGQPKLDTEASLGLWKACGMLSSKMNGNTAEIETCLHVPIDGVKRFPKNSLHICRTLVIVSYSLLIASVFIGLNSPINLKKVGVPVLILASLCGIVANIIWASDFMHVSIDDKGAKIRMRPGSSFYLNLLASICPIISIVYICCV